MKRQRSGSADLVCGLLLVLFAGVASGASGPTSPPVFLTQEKPTPSAMALFKELRLLRAEISAAHLDSLVLLLEKTREEIESPSSDPSLLDEQIAGKEKELQAPSTPAALDKLQKDLQELKVTQAKMLPKWIN